MWRGWGLGSEEDVAMVWMNWSHPGEIARLLKARGSNKVNAEFVELAQDESNTTYAPQHHPNEEARPWV